MGIKYRRYEKNSSFDIQVFESDYYLGQSIFVQDVLLYMMRWGAIEINLLNDYYGHTFQNDFYMVLKKETNAEQFRHFTAICEKYLYKIFNGFEQIIIEGEYPELEKIYIFRIKYDNFFLDRKLSIKTISMAYNIMTLEIEELCKKENFYNFKNDTYEKLNKSTLILEHCKEINKSEIKYRINRRWKKHFVLLAKMVFKNNTIACPLNNMLTNCVTIKEILNKNFFKIPENDYDIIRAVLFGLYKIGLYNFDLSPDLKKMINYYGYIRQRKKPSDNKNNDISTAKCANRQIWYILCSRLRCPHIKSRFHYCNNVVSPFNHMYYEKKFCSVQMNYEGKFIISKKPESVKTWLNNNDRQLEDIVFLVIFFGTLSIVNKKYSIIHNLKEYNNIPPILINVDSEKIIPICEKILELIPETTITLERNFKPQHVLKTIKEKKAVAFLDIDGDERFNLLKIFKNNDKNSQLSKEIMSGIRYHYKSNNKICYTLGIYENNRLKSYFLKNNRANKFFNSAYVFDFPYFDMKENFMVSTEKMKDFFKHAEKIFVNCEPLYVTLFDSELEIDLFTKKNEIESLRNKKSYVNLLCACIIFISVYNSFCKKTEVSINKYTIEDGAELLEYICSLLLKSQKSFGDTVARHKKGIIKRLVNAEPHFTYLTERELYKFVNQAITNRDVAFAINELINENILTEIIPLARGIRKGPKGRMFLVNNFELGIAIDESGYSYENPPL